jgi:hypothetical protein
MKADYEEKKRVGVEEGSPVRKQKIPLAISSKVTKRPHLQIMEKIRQKLAMQL